MEERLQALAKVTSVARSPGGHADNIGASRVQVFHALHDDIHPRVGITVVTLK